MAENSEMMTLAGDLVHFMKNKLGFDRLPSIKFIKNKENSTKVLGKTGEYNPDSEEIKIYTLNRHPKDVLRSLAHEMIHHNQKCTGKTEEGDMSGTRDPNYIIKDEFLKSLEEEAFRDGNLIFREWEAHKKGGSKELNEMKKTEKKFDKKKADLDNDGKLSGYEKKRGAAIQKSMGGDKKKLKEMEDGGRIVNLSRPIKTASGTREIPAGSYRVEKTSQPGILSIHTNSDAHSSHLGDVREKDIGGGEDMSMNNFNHGSMNESKEIKVNEVLKNSLTYLPEERVGREHYQEREAVVYEKLLEKFGIKKKSGK